jgi:hypothetical protein
MSLTPPRRSAALALLLAAACTTATIRRPDGFDTEAWVDHSDQRTLYLRDAQGRPFRLQHEEVVDIDHPGNVALTIGGTFGLLWGVAYASLHASDREKNAPRAVLTFAPLAALALVGGYIYFRSKGAARNFEEAPTILRIGPVRSPARPVVAPPDAGTDAADAG